MLTLQNKDLKITINPIGAELSSIQSVRNKKDFMWNGDPTIWSGISPILFPIVGSLKNDSYFYQEKKYKLPRHGFFRKRKDIELVEQSTNSITLKLSSSKELYTSYPFHFEVLITYTLVGNTITISHTIINCDTKKMYASIGAHPAFKCPIYENESYSDYFLYFENKENSESITLEENGLLSSNTKPVFDTDNTINLHPNLFKQDALIFTDLKSKKITLTSKSKGAVVSLYYPDFPYLGIWAKPNANYVCIEPWQGIADHFEANMQLKDKLGMVKIEAEETYKASYRIEIHQEHLL